MGSSGAGTEVAEGTCKPQGGGCQATEIRSTEEPEGQYVPFLWEEAVPWGPR